jgi:hypothetical protein
MLRIGVVMEICLYIYYFYRYFSVFYRFDNIFVSFYPNIMIFGTFSRVFKVVPKTGLNRSLTGPKTAKDRGLVRSWSFAVHQFSVFCGLGPVQSWSLAGPRTEPLNTIHKSDVR